MEINYAGKVEKKDFLKILSIHNRHLNLQKWIIGFLLLIMIVSLLYLSITKAMNITRILPGLLFMLIFVSFPWWSPYIQMQAFFREGMIYQDNVFGHINDSGISINNKKVKAEFLWNSYISYKIKDNIVLLYQGKANMSIFLKSMFANENDWNQFLITIKGKVPLKS
jgi:hypothetical protein